MRLKNWRAGFGWVSRCEREAITLAQLEQQKLPGPQWLAYGHDARGRAFLLVDEIAHASDCRVVATRVSLTATQRRSLIEKTATTIASFHNAGFTTPELAAKHLLVNPEPGEVSLIDWQSSSSDKPIRESDRQTWLAGLQASLCESAATPRERLRFARAYVKTHGNGTKTRLAVFVKPIIEMAELMRTRTSKQLQLQEIETRQRLVWLAGETVCVIPEMVKHWPRPVDGEPFYTGHVGTESLMLSNRDLLLTRFVSDSPLSRAVAWTRGKPWRSPAATSRATVVSPGSVRHCRTPIDWLWAKADEPTNRGIVHRL